MKFSSSQLAYLMRNSEGRANLRALLKYVLTLLALITLYAVLFHVIKGRVEGEQHSWVTGFFPRATRSSPDRASATPAFGRRLASA